MHKFYLKKMCMQHIEKKRLEENILKCQQWFILRWDLGFLYFRVLHQTCCLCNLNFIYLYLNQILQPTVLFPSCSNFPLSSISG